MEPNKQPQPLNPTIIAGSVLCAFLLLSVIFVYLFQNEVKTIKLLRSEYAILNQQKRIIEAASHISQEYKDEIDVISGIFPNEQTIPMFIQTLEYLIKQSSDEYTFRFNSLTPIVEGDKLYLLMTVTMKTDYEKFIGFLTNIEKTPYMTHVTGITGKMPNGYTGKGEVSIGLKVYVQNPFSTSK